MNVVLGLGIIDHSHGSCRNILPQLWCPCTGWTYN